MNLDLSLFEEFMKGQGQPDCRFEAEASSTPWREVFKEELDKLYIGKLISAVQSNPYKGNLVHPRSSSLFTLAKKPKFN
jgi:hypothetical protein